MARKLFLRSNDEIARDRISARAVHSISNKITHTANENTQYMQSQTPIYANKPQLRPRMILEGADALSVWDKERQHYDD